MLAILILGMVFPPSATGAPLPSLPIDATLAGREGNATNATDGIGLPGPSQASVSPTSTTILNGGFEAGTQSWSFFPTNGCAFEARQAPEWRWSGNWSLKFNDPFSNGICQAFQDISVTAGENIVAEAVVKMAGLGPNEGVQIWIEQSGQLLAFGTVVNNGVGFLTASAVVPSTGSVRVSIRTPMPTTTEASYVDDVRVTRAADNPPERPLGSQLRNTGFEDSGLSNWAILGTQPACVHQVVGSPYWVDTGTASARIVDNAVDASCGIGQWLDAVPGEDLVFSTKVRVNSTSGGVTLSLRWEDANGAVLKTVSSSADNALSVFGLTVSGRTPAGATQVFVAFETRYERIVEAFVDTFRQTHLDTNRPPVPGFSYVVGASTVSVDASGTTDPDGNMPLNYTWDWEDGDLGYGVSATHVFDCDRVFVNITLTVYDGIDGTASMTQLAILDSDTDGDGLSNCEELFYGTNPNVGGGDSDLDGMGDGEELAEWNAYGADAWETNYNASRPASMQANNLLEPDADGDGLPDGIEMEAPTSIFGDCTAIRGRFECPHPAIRDIYVQVNWMTQTACVPVCRSTQPSNGNIADVQANFDTHNEGKPPRDRVQLHIYLGMSGSDGTSIFQTPISFDERPGPFNDFYDWKEAYFPADRRGYFHFGLFAEQDVGNDAAGQGEAFGDDFVIFAGHIRTVQSVEAVWMQELGHNVLGLYHSLCQSDPIHISGPEHYNHNPKATHFRPQNEEAGNTDYDEGNGATGTCNGPDGVQDIFAHSSDATDAMSFSYDEANFFGWSYSDATWNAIEVWKGAVAGSPDFVLAGHEGHEHSHRSVVVLPAEVVKRWDEVNLRVARSLSSP